MKSLRQVACGVAVVAAFALAGCGGSHSVDSVINEQPNFVKNLSSIHYDGTTDDLLTGGLGKTKLAAATPPPLADPSHPTAAGLRRLAIYNNYRALVDMSSNGGYGRFWGPNVDLNGNDTLGEGLIAGTEYIAFSDDGSGQRNVTLMVQVPDNFDVNNACIVTATSSGSRGVYGAVSAAGEWGLKRHCAVAYTDKGTGNGAHELMTNTVTRIDGTLDTAANAGTNSLFTANVAAADLAAFNTAFPNRYAFKHAHSQQNPEMNWGQFTLQAVQMAFYVLNEQFGDALPAGHHTVRFKAGNTVVIAASVSNGGGAALAAAEQDTQNLISAVVVGEPQINLRVPTGLTIVRPGVVETAVGHPLYDYVTTANLLEPCAAYAAAGAGAPFLSSIPVATAQARCASLAANGLVTGADFPSQASDALARLHTAGYEPESDLLHAAMWGLQAVPAVAVTYADAYARASVTENLCGFSFGTTSATGQAGVASAVSPMVTVFGNGNGVPPTNGINLIYNNGTSGAAVHTLATADASFAGANCLRHLWTGTDALAARVQQGVDQVRYTANLHGKPAIIVQGRSDALVPINNASRPYFGMNRLAEGAASQLSFYEITNGQHFDAFLSLAGFDTRFVPVHYYNVQALNLMWSHLKNGTPLPPSQVVRTVPRGGTAGAAPALSVQNMPGIATDPGANAITFANNTVSVPN